MSFFKKASNKLYEWMYSAKNPVSSYHAYPKILEVIDSGSTILDVGAGIGIYFTNPKVISLIKSKDLRIHCIDIDESAIESCKRRIDSADLQAHVTAECIDVLKIDQEFDYALFIMSYPVVPADIFSQYIMHLRLYIRKSMLFMHNLVEKKSRILAFIKSRLWMITGCDFGRLTSVDDMYKQLVDWGFGEYTIESILSAQYSDIIPMLGFIPKKLKCTQYLIKADLSCV